MDDADAEPLDLPEMRTYKECLVFFHAVVDVSWFGNFARRFERLAQQRPGDARESAERFWARITKAQRRNILKNYAIRRLE